MTTFKRARRGQYEPKRARKAIEMLRMAYGLPIIADRVYNNPPFGYYRSPYNERLMLPNVRLLRALRVAYKAFNDGYTGPVLVEWYKENTGYALRTDTFSRLYHSRPVFKEIEEPLHERERLYRSALAEAETNAQEAYEDHLKQENPRGRKGGKTLEELELQIEDYGGSPEKLGGEAESPSNEE
jgi:hypothetical protein